MEKVGGAGPPLPGCEGRKGALGGHGGSRVPLAELGLQVGSEWGRDGRRLELRFLLVSFCGGGSALPTCHCGKGSAHLCP